VVIFCCLLLLWALAVGEFFAYVKIKSDQAENAGGGGAVTVGGSNNNDDDMMAPFPAPLIITRPPALADYDPSTIVALPESVAAYPACYVCGDNLEQELMSQVMSNPKELVYISPQNSMEFISSNNYNYGKGGIETDVSCETLRIAGLYGFIDIDSCSNLQNQLSMKERCGCNIIVSTTSTSTDADAAGDTDEDEEDIDATTTVSATIIDKSDIPCYLCGSEDATLANPDSILVLPEFLGYPDDFTCSNLDRLGRFNDGNSISEVGCNILQSQTEILIQCGCSNIIGISTNSTNSDESGTETIATGSSGVAGGGQDGVDASTNNGEITDSNFALPSFPPCYICGDGGDSMSSNASGGARTTDSTGYIVSNVRSPKIGTLTLPSNILTLPSSDTATCQDINAVGISGFIQPDGCIALQSNDIMIQCGCSNALIVEEDEDEDPAVVIQPSFPSCFICGESNSGLIGNPDAILSLPSALGFGDNASCQDVNAVGVIGYISPGACAIIQEEKEIIDNCGGGGGGPPAGVGGPPPGVEEEEVSENFPPCYWCGGSSEESDTTSSNPDYVLDLPPFLGYPPGTTTCGDLERIGRFDGTISPRGCGIVKDQTAILEQCGCEISV
jgi:hypothetical protein